MRNHPSPDRLARQKQLILAGVLLLYALAFAALLSCQPQILARSDHLSRWYPTQKLLYEGRSLYDPRNRLEVNALNTIPVDPIESSFFYPAHLILLTAPLVVFDYAVAHFIWVFLIQVFYIGGLWLIARRLDWPGAVNPLTVFLWLAVFFIPNVQNTIWGQFNTVNVITLALIYLALRQGKDLLAGALALGLTFKPQTTLLTILLLLFWTALNRRGRFWIGFGAVCAAALALTLWLEPGWIGSFWQGLRDYNAHHHPQGVLDGLGALRLPVQGLLLAGCAVLAWRARHAQPGEASFDLLLVLIWFVWWLITPVLGMMHLVMLPLGVLFLLPHLRQASPRLHAWGWRILLGLYLLGLAGFFYGLSTPELYGLHIRLAELAYKILMPLWIVVLAGWLLSRRKSSPSPEAYS